MERRVYQAEKIFTGSEFLEEHSVVVSDGKIVDIVPSNALTEGPSFKYYLLAPAFIDLQIYGAKDKLLAVYPEARSLHTLFDYCSKGGASHFQPTVATNSPTVFYQCIDAVKDYWKEGGKGCLGLHIEGPWIHTQKKGAHIELFIHPPSVDEVKQLLEYGKEVISMITLAPEICSQEVIDLIRSYGVIISAGHSNATYEEATIAFDSGINTATHLYNAMSPLQHRAPGIVGAVFDHATVMASIVPDGFHVDFSAIRIAKKILKERLFVITDAVTETVDGPYRHHLTEEKYEADGILSGSALTMAKSLRNLVNHVGIEVDEALRMVSLYPAQVMNKADRMGRIEKGYKANLVMLDRSLDVKETIVN
jgi:N-acetylglucosamine-6-phosphate deacetylase